MIDFLGVLAGSDVKWWFGPKEQIFLKTNASKSRLTQALKKAPQAVYLDTGFNQWVVPKTFVRYLNQKDQIR